MFVVPLKTSPSKDVKTPLSSWLSDEVSAFFADSFAPDFSTLQTLRNNVTSVKSHDATGALNSLVEYHAALNALEGAGFPIQEGDSYKMNVVWKCAFEAGKKVTRSNVRYERVAGEISSLEKHFPTFHSLTTKKKKNPSSLLRT